MNISPPIFARIAVVALAAALLPLSGCKKAEPKSTNVSQASEITDAPEQPSATPKEKDPCEPPTEYKNEPVAVAMDVDVNQNGKKFTIKGKPLKDATLPDGTRISVRVDTCVGGAKVGASEVVTVKGGGFECSPNSEFDGGEQLPAGEYYLQAFIYPNDQPTALQAVFGECGVNLTGSQVQPDGGGGKVVCYDQHFVKIDSPEGKEIEREMEHEVKRRQIEFGFLFRELQRLRDDPAFVDQGLSSESGKAWLLRLRKAGQADRSRGGNYGKQVAARLEVLGLSYQKSKGVETERTDNDLRLYLREYQKKLGPNFLGMWGGSITGFMNKLTKGRLSINDAKGSIISNEVTNLLKVTSTSEEYVFYTAENPYPFPFQIAVERVPGVFYGDGTRLKQKNLLVVGAGRFATVMGAGKDVVIFKALPE